MAYKRNGDGAIILESGELISKAEQRQYILMVKRVNEKRSRLIDRYYENAKNTPNMINVSKEAYTSLLEEKGFVSERLTTSFKGIVNIDEFRGEFEDLQTLTSKGYHEGKLDTLRTTMIRQIKENIGGSSQYEEVMNTIENMSDSELTSLYIHSDKDILSELFGSDGSSDDEEERGESLKSTIEALTKNITIRGTDNETRKIKKQRMKELKETPPKKRGNLLRKRRR